MNNENSGEEEEDGQIESPLSDSIQMDEFGSRIRATGEKLVTLVALC